MKTPYSNRLFLGLCVMYLIAGLSFCSHVEIKQLSDEELFSKGQEKFTQGHYRSAREFLLDLKNRFPDSKHIAATRLMLGDSYFFEKEYLEAQVQYEIFLKYHPADTNADYATYQLALCKKHDVLSFDRDQEPTHAAIAAFQQTISNFPNSRYGKDAQTNIDELKQVLAKHEIYVGTFYLKTKQYKSAMPRFEFVLRNYANLGMDTQCMYLMVKSFVKAKQLDDARVWFQNLQSQYKNDLWTSKAEKEFGSLFQSYSKNDEKLKTSESNN
jgi:outer membrane protein assembly factor BamD